MKFKISELPIKEIKAPTERVVIIGSGNCDDPIELPFKEPVIYKRGAYQQMQTITYICEDRH